MSRSDPAPQFPEPRAQAIVGSRHPEVGRVRGGRVDAGIRMRRSAVRIDGSEMPDGRQERADTLLDGDPAAGCDATLELAGPAAGGASCLGIARGRRRGAARSAGMPDRMVRDPRRTGRADESG